MESYWRTVEKRLQNAAQEKVDQWWFAMKMKEGCKRPTPQQIRAYQLLAEPKRVHIEANSNIEEKDPRQH